jgi:8-oxo-dGTP diphosphatase
VKSESDGGAAPLPAKMTVVVAAIIKSEGRLLICQRRAGDAFALKWEFPGGKVNRGEDPATALERELGEELGVAATIGREVYRTRHLYAELPDEIELIFFSVEADPATVRNLVFEQILWAKPADLHVMDFLPADSELVAKLASGALRIE